MHAWSFRDCVYVFVEFFLSLMKLRASSHVWIFCFHLKLKLRVSCFIPNVDYMRSSGQAAILIVSYCWEGAAAIQNYLISFLFFFSLSSFLSSLPLSPAPWGTVMTFGSSLLYLIYCHDALFVFSWHGRSSWSALSQNSVHLKHASSVPGGFR